MSNMACGNTATLRAYEALQDRLDRQAPTELELERFVEDWMERKAKKMGEMFIIEALSESDYSPLFKAYQEQDALEIGITVQKIVANYWRNSAEEAANGHNFEEDR
jgi:predicted 2-oxoglutarate/Fe(II)-dependent dioxygenase YbiX